MKFRKNNKSWIGITWREAELDGVLEKYHETLACILGNSFLYGSDEQKAKVSKAISEVVNLVMYAHG